ncbi:MAG: hypothetical protein C0507_14315 [Cyanobacteria bacterium PR.3.49]|jgi:hypothetical protein|nr:hypothetical protein [Cyanobacteria bacterium PR.3.49]
MNEYWLRHVMAAIIVSEELKVPNMRQGDAYLADDRMRKQFTALIENTYCIADLMIEIGDRRLATGQ